MKDIKDSRYFSANFDETLNPVMDVQISQVNLIVIRVQFQFIQITKAKCWLKFTTFFKQRVSIIL